jgi:hypothetical protein
VVSLLPAAVFGQVFQGGIRGFDQGQRRRHSGLEVTLTQRRTNIARQYGDERSAAEYVFTQIDPGSYVMMAALTGYKTDRAAPEIPIGHAAGSSPWTHDGGRRDRRENITVTGQSPIIETSNASQGTVLDSQALNTLPSPGRAAFLVGASVPTVVPSGDSAVQPAAGSDQRVAAVARRRHAARQQLTRSTACRSPT